MTHQRGTDPLDKKMEAEVIQNTAQELFPYNDLWLPILKNMIKEEDWALQARLVSHVVNQAWDDVISSTIEFRVAQEIHAIDQIDPYTLTDYIGIEADQVEESSIDDNYYVIEDRVLTQRNAAVKYSERLCQPGPAMDKLNQFISWKRNITHRFTLIALECWVVRDDALQGVVSKFFALYLRKGDLVVARQWIYGVQATLPIEQNISWIHQLKCQLWDKCSELTNANPKHAALMPDLNGRVPSCRCSGEHFDNCVVSTSSKSLK